MKIKSMLSMFLKEDFRNFIVIFWTFVFPLVFFLFFTSLFGNISNSSENSSDMEFRAGIYFEKPPTGLAKEISHGLVTGLGDKNSGGPFENIYVSSFDEGIQLLKDKKLEIFIVFPENLDMLNLKVILSSVPAPVVKSYYRSDSGSDFARKIFKSVLDSVNVEFYKRISSAEYTLQVQELNKKASENFSYKDYLFPSVLLMSILTVSIFNTPLSLAYSIEKGITKKIFTTPIRSGHFFTVVLLENLILLGISILLIYIEGKIMGVSPKAFSAKYIAYLFMNVVTLISVGLLMLSVFRKLSAVNVAANILYQLMMFLGGLFFDVSHTPMIIRWFVYINPVSYMAQGLRNIINGAPLGFLNYFVPLLWIGACIIIFSLNFKKVMNYE